MENLITHDLWYLQEKFGFTDEDMQSVPQATVVWHVVRYQILKLEIQIFFYFLCFVNISTKGTKSKNYIFSFYIATFEHSLNWGETAKFEFLRARF